uniref:Uncharacterized protein n=1 Tax=Candidatus Nitrotoga fabula TaxID=2182327 RepID=A0A2X0SKY9_9PROT|nr:protein of unknown function [Candidatus Nitrotoga fabula]
MTVGSAEPFTRLAGDFVCTLSMGVHLPPPEDHPTLTDCECQVCLNLKFPNCLACRMVWQGWLR